MTPPSPTFRLALTSVLAGLAGFGVAQLVAKGEKLRRPVEIEKPGGGAVGAGVDDAAAEADQGAAGKGTALEALAEAVGEKDFFRRAAKVFAAIERLSAEDFAEVARARRLPAGIGGRDGGPFGDAARDALVERWLAVDAEGAVRAIVEMTSLGPDKKRMPGGRELRETLARLRPAEFLAAGAQLPAEETKTDWEWPWKTALTALARTQPEAARRMASEMPEKKRDAAAGAIAMGIAETDPVAALRLAKDVMNPSEVIEAAIRAAERAGPGVVRQLLEATPDLLQHEKLAVLAARYPELTAGMKLLPMRQDSRHAAAIRAAIDGLPASELRKRLEEREKIPNGARHLMAGLLLEAWAMEAPAEATAWAVARVEMDGGPEKMAAAQKAFAVWREKDWKAALGWLDTLPASAEKTALTNRSALALMQRGDLDGAMAMYVPEAKAADSWESYSLTIKAHDNYREMGGGNQEDRLLAWAATKRDPEQAADWLAAFPYTFENHQVLQQTLFTWGAQDATAAAQWAEALPPGQRRDEVYVSLAYVALRKDGGAAAEWVAAIEDPTIRERMTHSLDETFSEADRENALAWLVGRPGVTEEERAFLERRKR